MFRYQPPKAAVWGHRLGRLSARQIDELVHRFLATATGEHEFTSGVLSADITSPESDLARDLLAIAGKRQWHMPAEATARCVAVLAEWEDRNQRRPECVQLLQACEIREWRLRGRLVPTSSQLNVNYGALPCLSTFLHFDGLEDFELIGKALSDLGICRLNPKHLKPLRPLPVSQQPRKEP
jgi:hypothetical protein